MAANEPQSNEAAGNTPQNINLKISQLEGQLKGEYLGSFVISVLGATPVLFLGLNYMGAIAFGGWVQILLWVFFAMAILLGIGITVNVGKYTQQLNYLQQLKTETGFHFSTNNPQLLQLTKETMAHLRAYYTHVQKESARSSVFYTTLAIAAMLLTAAAISGISNTPGIGNFILLGTAVAFALFALLAYTNKRKEIADLLRQYEQKLTSLQQLISYLYLLEQTSNEEEKKLMTQKMIDNFLGI